MSAPDKCPKCGSDRINSDGFACGSGPYFNSPGFSEAWNCAIRQRDQLAARVKKLAAYAERLESTGDNLAIWAPREPWRKLWADAKEAKP